MNRSFDFVLNSQLNRSRSKEVHAFPKAVRFNKPAVSPCLSNSYDLTSTMMSSKISKKTSVLPKETRFRQSQSLSPPPNTYRTADFIETNIHLNRGTKFGKESRIEIDKKAPKTPGPGAYNPNKKNQPCLSYTMRMKPQVKNQVMKVGPGEYATQLYDSIGQAKAITSKYNRQQQVKISKAERFKEAKYSKAVPGPGAYNSSLNFASKLEMEQNAHAVYTFPKDPRGSWRTLKTISPGPGAYQQFSEFSERGKRMLDTLQKMQTLTRYSRN